MIYVHLFYVDSFPLSFCFQTQALVEVGGAIIFCEERLNQANNWRVHSDLLNQLAVLPYCLPVDYISANFVPILFHRLLHLVSRLKIH